MGPLIGVNPADRLWFYVLVPPDRGHAQAKLAPADVRTVGARGTRQTRAVKGVKIAPKYRSPEGDVGGAGRDASGWRRYQRGAFIQRQTWSEIDHLTRFPKVPYGAL